MRQVLTWLSVIALVGSAVVSSNLFAIRERLFGSALPMAVPVATSREAGPSSGNTDAGRSALRSTPWWQQIVALEGSGTTTSAPLTIDRGAIQWRMAGTCGSGRLVVRVPGRATPLLDAACPDGATGFDDRSGATSLEVTSDGPWRLVVAQRIDLPLVEPPLPAMTAAGTRAIATGTFSKIDRTGAGVVTLFDQADGRYAVRLEDFFVSPSSQLQLRLSTLESPRTTEEYLGARSQLLALLDVTAGSLNYTAPVGVDPSDFRSLVIFDPSANSAYAAATLEPVT